MEDTQSIRKSQRIRKSTGLFGDFVVDNIFQSKECITADEIDDSDFESMGK